MYRSNRRSSRIKREPTVEAVTPSPIPHRQASSTPRSVSAAMIDQDSHMVDVGAASQVVQEELSSTVASARAASSVPTPHPAAIPDSESDVNGIDILGRRVKSLVQAIDKLQSLGIETKDLPLPKIVVVGDQSAGKSSLIEGISGIKVPRSAGTCTRCPLQITLMPTEVDDRQWSCTITILKQYDLYTTPALDENGKLSSFGPWDLRQDCEEIPFAYTTNKTALEDLIRRAQFACLNPGDRPARYLDAEDVTQLPLKVQFSPNIVRLEIKEPSSPSLSFVDLPGVINQTEDSADRWLVKFVKNLVKSYIANPNSLILLACSMESDMHNSRASKLVEDGKGAKERCVGVLTKPDRLPTDNRFEDIRKVLGNESFRVGHGYYVAMQPSQAQLDNGVTADEARLQEQEFFAQQPWSTVLSAYSDRFGTAQLQVALSHKLAGQIITSLPDISGRISLRLEHVEEELKGYPDPPRNAMGHVLEAVTMFATLTERHIGGNHGFNNFRNSIKKAAIHFSKDLLGQGPILLYDTPSGRSTATPVTVSLVSDDSESETAPTPCPSVGPSPTKKRRLEADAGQSMDGIKTPQRAPRNTAPQDSPALQTGPAIQTGLRKSFSLGEIRATLNNLTMSDIPNEIDPKAVDHLRLQCLVEWHTPTEAFLNSVATTLGSKLHDLLEEACYKWRNTEFYRETDRMIADFVTTVIAEQQAYAERALRLERHKPFTMNEEDIKRKVQEELEKLGIKRFDKRANEYLDKQERRVGKPTTDEDRKKKVQQNEGKLREVLGADPYRREVEVMGKIGGYYRVAVLRFLDHVVQGVQVEVFDKCLSELPQQLKLGLELDTENAMDHCTHLLAEDKAREQRRVLLKNEKLKLQEAQHWLRGLDVSR